MPFESGHQKLGGRRKGTPNQTTAEGRELARRLVFDAEYQKRLRQRLIAGEGGSLEPLLWQYAFGRPGAPTFPESDDTLAAMLERIDAAERDGAGPRDPRPPRRQAVPLEPGDGVRTTPSVH